MWQTRVLGALMLGLTAGVAAVRPVSAQDRAVHLAVRGGGFNGLSSLNDAGTGSDLNRFFYDGALQLQYPGESGWEPYVFVGAGAVTLHPVGTSDSDDKLSELSGNLSSFDKTQVDVTWNAGFTYRIPFGASSVARVAR